MVPAQSAIVAALADRYIIEHPLGEGGMATVWRARDLRHERDVAIKVLRPELAAALGVERFLREVRVTAALQHPNILPLFDSGEVEGLPWYVMPYVGGETLRDRLRRERQLPVHEAVGIARQVAAALGHAHQQDIVHRDVKPENILLQGDHAYVADFGIALAVIRAEEGRLTETGVSIGTPSYMSPEQATGDRDIDGRSDQWALAAMLYEMLAGEPPHAGTTIQALIARIVSEPPTALTVMRPKVAAALDAVVMRGLQKVPADRYPTVELFDAALASAMDPAQIPTDSRRSSRVGKAPRAGMGIAAIALTVILAAVAVWRWPGSRAPHAPVSIAVIPCEDRTGDPTLAYVAEGLSENLVNRLTAVSDLRVLPRGVVRVAARENPDRLQEVARTLTASHLVTCSVSRAGDGIRVGAQLMQVEPLQELWADGGIAPQESAVLAIEDSLLQRVVASMPVRVTDKERQELAAGDTRDGEAQRLFLLGRHHWHRFTEPELRTALGYFEQAVARDPTYARAYAGLAMTNMVMGSLRILDQHVAIARSKDAIDRGLAIRPDDADLLAQRAIMGAWFDRDLATARRDAMRAVALRPDNSLTHQALQHVLAAAGDFEGALAANDRALHLDPLFARLHTDRAMYLFLGRHPAADVAQSAVQAIALDPGSTTGHIWGAYAAALSGQQAEALAELGRLEEIAPGAPFLTAERAAILGILGETNAARTLLQLIEEGEPSRAEPVTMAAAWNLAGDRARALEWLEHAEREGSRWLMAVPFDLRFDAMRGEPRFDALVRRIREPRMN